MGALTFLAVHMKNLNATLMLLNFPVMSAKSNCQFCVSYPVVRLACATNGFEQSTVAMEVSF